MSIEEIIEEAQDLEWEMQHQYRGDKVLEYAQKGLDLIGNHQLGEKGYELKNSFLNSIIQLHNMGNRGDLAFPYLMTYRQLLPEDGKHLTYRRFAYLLSNALSELAEIRSITDTELNGLIEEVLNYRSLEEDDYEIGFILLNVYQKRNFSKKTEEIKQKLLQEAIPVKVTVGRCDACKKVVQIRRMVQLGLIKEAEKAMQALLNLESFLCARSPRIGAAALLDHYLEEEDLVAAKPHAELLQEHIDFAWDADASFINPLYTYQIELDQLDKAIYWVNRLGPEMQESLLDIQRSRFWKSTESLLNKLAASGRKDLDWIEFEFKDFGRPKDWDHLLLAVKNQQKVTSAQL